MKKTLEYLFKLEKGKRFITLYFLSLPVGVTLAFTSPTWGYARWINEYTTGNTDFWYNITLGRGGYDIPIAMIFLFFAALFFLSVQSSVISRSLRVGVFKMTGMMKEFNESFFPSLYAVCFYFLMFVLFKCILGFFLVIWQNVVSVSLSLFLSVSSQIIISALFVLGISLTILFVPIMNFSGVKPQAALLSSLQKCSRHIIRIALAGGIPFVIVILAGVLIGLLRIPLLSEILDVLMFSFLFCYYVSFSMISYYELEQIKREDYPIEYFYKGQK